MGVNDFLRCFLGTGSSLGLRSPGLRSALLHNLRHVKAHKLHPFVHTHTHTHIYVGSQRSRNTVKDTAIQAATLWFHNHKNRHTHRCLCSHPHTWANRHTAGHTVTHAQAGTLCSHARRHHQTCLDLFSPKPSCPWDPVAPPDPCGGQRTWHPHGRAGLTGSGDQEIGDQLWTLPFPVE